MKRCRNPGTKFLALLIVTLLALMLATTGHAEKLFWHNKESLMGTLLSADATHLTFKNELSTAPAVLDRSRLQLLHFSDVPPSATPFKSQWAVLLREGDGVLGEEPTITGETLTLKTPRHGALTLPLKQIRSLRRLQGAGLTFAGPSGTSGWVGDAFVAEAGSLFTRRWNTTLTHELVLPERLECAFKLRAVLLPDLEIFFASDNTLTPRLETWGKELVLRPPRETKVVSLSGKPTHQPFLPVRTLDDKQREIALRLFWDKPAQRVVVCADNGQMIGEMIWEKVVPKPTKAPVIKSKSEVKPPLRQGLFFRNRGSSLVLDDVLLRPWDGALPALAPTGYPRIEMTDGSVRTSTLKGLDLSQVQSVSFIAEHPPLQPQQPRACTTFTDGTLLSGPLQSYGSGQMTVQTTWATGPITSTTDDVTRIVFDPPASVPEPVLNSLDKLHSGTVTLHGTIVCNGGPQPLWQLIGASEALPLVLPAKREDIDLTWRPAAATAPPTTKTSALLIVKGGDVLGAQLQGIDATSVSFTSPWSEVPSLSHAQLRAIRLNNSATQPKGFRDASWGIIKGVDALIKQTRGDKPEQDTVMLSPGMIFGHPSLLQGDDISFVMKMPQNYGGLGVTLFADAENTSAGLRLILYFSGSQLYIVEGDGNRGVRSDQILNGLTDPKVNIRLTFKDNKVQVYANDVRLLDQVLPPDKQRSGALHFSPNSMWGNSQNPVEITNFNVNSRATDLPTLTAPEDAKRRALTVPRYRRELLPAHLLIAANGDMIRGSIEAATDRMVRFSSGLDVTQVPLDRVQSIVWLTPPVAAPVKAGQAAEALPPASHWVVLNDQTRLALQIESFQSDKVIARSALFGRCTLPLAMLSTLRWAAPPASPAMQSYSDWQLEHAVEPVLPETGGQADPLLGKAAPDFKLKLLYEGEVQLAKVKGEVVVLDFWATWCGPCIASMPELLKVMATFKNKKVRFLCVNQGEPAAPVKRFIEQRHWSLPVALDSDSEVGRLYHVDGIPHTVVIGLDGKIAWSMTGAAPDGAEKLTEAITKALGATASDRTPR